MSLTFLWSARSNAIASCCLAPDALRLRLAPRLRLLALPRLALRLLLPRLFERLLLVPDRLRVD
jgi:hypothetical protein